MAISKWIYDMPIAHRGLHDKHIPENSMAAFENAIKHHYAIELDVQITKDGKVIVFHDYDTLRMTGEKYLIKDLTWEQIQPMYLNSNKKQTSQFISMKEQIPLLLDVLTMVNGKVPLLVEIKNEGKPGSLEAATCNLLKNYQGEFAVQSFNPFSLSYIRRLCPNMTRGQLSSAFSKEQPLPLSKRLVKDLYCNIISKPEFVGYNIKDLPNKKVERLRKKGMCILGWTIRDDAEREKARRYCDNIIFE